MKKAMYITVLISFLLISCERAPGEVSKEHVEEYEGCLTKYPKDSADYKHVTCNFFIGKDGELYKKKTAVDKFSPPYCNSVYFDKYYHKHYEDSVVDIPLISIIDIQSLVCFDSSSYSKDKKRCFYYYDTSDGGFITIIPEADVATFQPLAHSWWAKDKNYVYYRGDIVTGADPASIKLIDGKMEEAQDKNHKYKEGEMIWNDSALKISQTGGRN